VSLFKFWIRRSNSKDDGMGRTCSAHGCNKYGSVEGNTKMNLGKVMCECRQDSRGSECGTVALFVNRMMNVSVSIKDGKVLIT
jgi:hypothetical protein